MLFTDYEGTEYVCPVKTYYDHLEERYEEPKCEASCCIAWRWYDKPDCGGDRRGYCGLAGRPQHEE